MVVGEPMVLPAGMSGEAQAGACRDLEAVLDRIRRRACALAGVEA
jgi:hypothetical protein